MATDVPLLSSYKRDFVRRRLGHTLTGIKFFPGPTPWYSLIIRLAIWVIPGALSCASSFIVTTPSYLPWIIVGFVVFLLSFLLQAFSIWRQSKEDGGRTNLTMDEEESPPWDGIMGGITWSLLVPAKVHKVNIFLHSLLAGLLAASSPVVLRFEIVQNIFGYGGGAVVSGFSWLTVFITLQSLIGIAPSETATYRHVDHLEINALTRPLHLIVCQTLTFLGLYFWNFLNIATIFYVIQTSLPFIWFLGILPPIESFLLWFGEQLLIFCFGGSTAATSSRLALYLFISIIQFTILFFSGSSARHVIILSALSGYIISTNLIGLCKLSCLRSSSKVKDEIFKVSRNNGKVAKTNLRRSVSTIASMLQDIFTHIILFILTIILSFLLTKQNPYSHSLTSDSDKANPLAWVIVSYSVLVKLVQEAQKVYGVFGFIRSPFYSDSSSLGRTVLNNILIFLHPISTALVLLSYTLITASGDDLTEERIKRGDVTFCAELLASIRTFRWIWQNTDCALLETSMHHILNYFIMKSFKDVTLFKFVDEYLSFSQQLVLLSFCRDRFMQAIEKFYLFLCLSATSIEDRASRRSYALLLFQMNLFFFPVVFGVIILSSLISAPMLSFFTLPIFFLTFPRPARFWPGPVGISAAVSGDTIYYEQSVSPILTQLNVAARSGRLGSVQPESFFLLRHEDRIVWVQILEKGNGYFTFSLKGMELQETSCHSLEATRIDDVFESTFQKKTKINYFLFHTLTPLSSLKVNMYSDTRNVLTGVINSTDTLKIVAESFIETLIWLLVKCAKDYVQEKVVEETTSTRKLSEDTKDQVIRMDSTSNKDDNVEGVPETIMSASVEAMNLDSWPASSDSCEVSPWAARSQLNPLNSSDTINGKQRLASFNSSKYLGRPDSKVSLFEMGSDEEMSDDARMMDPHLPKLKHSFKEKHVEWNQSEENIMNQLDSIIPGIIDPLNSYKTPQLKRNRFMLDPVIITPTKLLEKFISLSPQSESYKIPQKWMEACSLNITEPPDWFPKEFFMSLISSIDARKDPGLYKHYTNFIQHIFQAIYGLDATPETGVISGPNHVIKHFNNLNSFPEVWPADMRNLVQHAYRISVKLALDKVLIGDMDADELVEAFEDLQANWYIGPEDDEGWAKSVRKEVPNLFSINLSTSSDNGLTYYKSHILSLRECEVAVGRLNKEVVKSLWASLSLELLYLTNDDEERYSIQAEERLLRNLTVQAADPPLGYAIYSSKPITKTGCDLQF